MVCNISKVYFAKPNSPFWCSGPLLCGMSKFEVPETGMNFYEAIRCFRARHVPAPLLLPMEMTFRTHISGIQTIRIGLQTPLQRGVTELASRAAVEEAGTSHLCALRCVCVSDNGYLVLYHAVCDMNSASRCCDIAWTVGSRAAGIRRELRVEFLFLLCDPG